MVEASRSSDPGGVGRANSIEPAPRPLAALPTEPRHFDRTREIPYEDDTDPRILEAVRALPSRQREVVALRVVLGLSAEQTATTLGIDPGTVGTHLCRALIALRRSLEPATPTTPQYTIQEIRP